MEHTEKLFYAQPPVLEFTARVLACEEDKKGWQVVLDRTAFYPEGGGQPADHGLLGGASVLDVHDAGGVIRHLTDRPLEPGSEVEGKVDALRRLDLTQQHSGEHILSGLLHSMFGAENVGFHIGEDYLLMDLSVQVDAEGLARAEEAANRVVWQDVPTEAVWYEKEQLARLTYRSKKELEGPVRLVTMPGADCCACCGTHVQRTGQVGQIKIIDHINYKSGTRLQVVCGTRALMRHRLVDGQCRRAGAALSAPVEGLADAVQRQKAELEAAKFRLTGLENQLFALWAAGETAENPLVCKPGLGPDGLRRLAAALSESRTGVCCAVSERADGGLNYAVACTRAGADLRPLCKEMNQTLDGRGGGKPGFVQGSLAADITALQAFWAAQHFTE